MALKALLPYRRGVVLVTHVVLMTVAYFLAFLLRFEFRIPADQWTVFFTTLPVLIAIRAIVFAWFHLYEGMWRYVSMYDIMAILKAGTVGSAIFSGVILIFWGQGFPRSILFIDWILCLALVGGVRLGLRAVRESYQNNGRVGGKRAVIVGAGDAGEMLIREIERNLTLNYEVVGFLDDDPRKQGGRIHGIEVVGRTDDLPYLCRYLKVQEILVAIPSASEEQQRRIFERCRASGTTFKTIPPLNDLLQGKARIGQLQEVKPEDLLGRKAIRLDTDALRRELKGKSIMVTGAAGSIGSELCRQLATFEPETVVLFDQAESALYFICLEIKNAHPGLGLIPIVGDILNREKVNEVIQTHKPDIVYHAAAYKHVPLMEEQPLEAINNNVLGTEVLACAAQRGGVKRFVLISTDKAVKPVGIMGMTKRMAEGVIQTLNGGSTSFVAVRFGNVLGSDGSVLPLFKWQIDRGGPVTVTDPEASRYFMLVSEAAQLVLQAGAMGKGGEIFFLDMGEPVRIGNLAENLIRLSGFEPGKDIPVEVIGLRPGERLNEELVMDGEELLPTEHEKILMLQNHRLDVAAFQRDFEALKQMVSARDRDGAVAQLKAMCARY